MYKNPGASENAIVESQINEDEENSSKIATASFNKQRATLLILERNIDLASVFAHDYSYGSLLFDMKDSANVIEETVQKYALKNGKTESLGRNDPIWQMYKSYHVGRAVKGVESEIGVFQKEQAQFIKISKKQNMSEEDMLTLVRK